MNLSPRQGVYAALTVLGVVATWHFNLQFMANHVGFSATDFIAGGFVNPAAASLSADVMVAFLTFLVWLPVEARRTGVRHWWIYVVLGFAIAFAFAFPLFLFMRERKLAAQSN